MWLKLIVGVGMRMPYKAYPVFELSCTEITANYFLVLYR